MKIKMVLAGNRRQFERYLDENGLTDSEARYVTEPQSILGYGHDYEIVEYGTCYENYYYHELKEFLIRNQYTTPNTRAKKCITDEKKDLKMV